jgi:cysteine synthase A
MIENKTKQFQKNREQFTKMSEFKIEEMVYTEKLLQLVGKTPLLDISHLPFIRDITQNGINILAKLEMFNYGGSVKDRPAMYMVQRAEENGILKKGSVILEPTSGNTGIALAWIGKLKGYKVKIVMPESMSEERKQLLRSYGAELILTPGAKGTDGAISHARSLARANEDYILLDQFKNQANVESHLVTTGPEIWDQTNGKIDYFVAGVGTGGTITGVSKYLKSRNPDLQIISVEPLPDPNKRIPGLKNLSIEDIPHIFSNENIDHEEFVDKSVALDIIQALAKHSLLVGPSSGAALGGLLNFIRLNKKISKGKTFVVIFPDTGVRYLSENNIEKGN